MNFKTIFLAFAIFTTGCHALTQSDISMHLYNQETDETIVRQLITADLKKTVCLEHGDQENVDEIVMGLVQDSMISINTKQDSRCDFIICALNEAVAILTYAPNEETNEPKDLICTVCIPDEQFNEQTELLIMQTAMEYVKQHTTAIRIINFFVHTKFATKNFSTLFKKLGFKPLYTKVFSPFTSPVYEWFNAPFMQTLTERDDSSISDTIKHAFNEWLNIDIEYQEKVMQDFFKPFNFNEEE